jgi:hypothetical protein
MRRHPPLPSMEAALLQLRDPTTTG